MKELRGTDGYREALEPFCRTSLSLSFEDVCRDFIPWLPEAPATVLDVGAGVGQNAMALADLGYQVTAIEPLSDFLDFARQHFHSREISWIQDSMPTLDCLRPPFGFDFILAEGVWHHLSHSEREQTLKRFGTLLRANGRCAISLRSGPPGAGRCVFPTDLNETIDQGARYGFECIFTKSNQPSILPNKSEVTWTRLVLSKKPTQ